MKREKLLNSLLMTMVVISLIIYQSVAIDAASGDLDTTFGIAGKVTTETGFDDKVNAAAIQADGKIVVAGTRANSIMSALLARYNTDGSLDASFGVSGIVNDAAHGGHLTIYNAVAIQADGKIVAAGYFYESGGCMRDQAWVVRYNADGSRDTTFGAGGAVEYPYLYVNGCPVSSFHYALAIQTNGKIVVASSSKNASSNFDFAATRLNTDGTLDTSFNLDGLATFPVGSGNDEAYSVAINPNSGAIILAGCSYTSPNNDFAFILLNSQGLYNWNFGGAGKVVTNTGGNDIASAVRFQADGKIIAAGRQSNGVNGTDFSLSRYNTNGSLDSAFGTGGKVVTAFSAYYDAAFGIALQSNGKAVAAGFGADNNALDTGYNFAVSRYNTNGSLDTTFTGDGKQMTDFINYQDHGRAVVIQADGKIVVAGYSWDGSNDNDIVLARYEP